MRWKLSSVLDWLWGVQVSGQTRRRRRRRRRRTEGGLGIRVVWYGMLGAYGAVARAK